VPARDATSERIEEFGIAPDPAVVRDLRHAVRRMCNGSDLSPDAGETAVLLASETLTNAIMHGGAPAHMVIRVSGNGVRVEVTDDSARAPVVAPASDEATNGRGIRLIDTLATRWGVQRHNHGKTVWFEVAPDSPC
jgi:anti-sigma regulatory factor (Ser/Thr protein kinase)